MHFRLFPLAVALCITHVYAGDSADVEIKRVLMAQVEAWNRGDIPGFVKTYSDDCTFVGKSILHGKADLEARYRQRYPTSEAMGRLHFTDLNVRLLDDHVAIVTGSWHLDRNTAGGGAVGGVYSLVFKRIDNVWRIVLDHTS